MFQKKKAVKEAPKAVWREQQQQMCFELAPARGMQPEKEARDADPQPRNLIPRGTSISFVDSLSLGQPSPPLLLSQPTHPPNLGTMSSPGASDHSNQTRIAGVGPRSQENAGLRASSAPQCSAPCSGLPFISRGLAFS